MSDYTLGGKINCAGAIPMQPTPGATLPAVIAQAIHVAGILTCAVYFDWNQQFLLVVEPGPKGVEDYLDEIRQLSKDYNLLNAPTQGNG